MTFINGDDIEIVKYSDIRYEMITIEIRFKGEPIAQINQDKGKDSLEIGIFTDYADTDGCEIKIPLSDFIEALLLSKKSLE